MHSVARFRIATAGAAVLALAACGGGGGSGSGSPSQPVAGPAPTPAPTPSPSPTTDPPATDRLPPAPFGLQASAAFALVGWQQIDTGGPGSFRLDQASERGTLAWSASEKTYLIGLADLGSGKLVYSFPPSGNNDVAFSIIQTNGSVARAYVTIFIRSANMGEIYWRTADGVQPFTYARAMFGIPVPAGGLPASGTKTFATGTSPQSSLVFDFASRKVSGTVTSFHDGGGWDPEGPIEKGTIAPTDIQPDGTFVAQLTVPGAPKTGELRGRLFGAAAGELGLYWNAPVRNGYGDWTDWHMVSNHPVCAAC